MGKVQRQGRKPHSTFGKSTVVRRQHSRPQAQRPAKGRAAAAAAAAAPSGGQHGRPQQARPKVPFTKHDNVLLVGEGRCVENAALAPHDLDASMLSRGGLLTNGPIGDFSFSLSLKRHHKVRQMVATCYDSKDVLQIKYPEVHNTISQLQSGGHSSPRHETDQGNEDEWQGFSPSPPNLPSHDQVKDHDTRLDKDTIYVLYGIDATKLSSAHKKALRPYSPFTKIVFNFPHVGGLSTDVNRQVRYNQELLVGFFRSAKLLLSSPNRPATVRQVTEQDDDMSDYDEIAEESDSPVPGAVNGKILVTLFEGEPYTLWNIRDLARHCGLKVVESFKFPWSAYPEYRHARTAGDIITGKDRSDEGKRKGAWRGEEREARCYVMEDRDAEPVEVMSPQRKRRRRQGSDGDDSD
ncbi:hypothetical protein AYL99_03373 [Fonsecaea erecta]|uniref:25S rRNA (uridine-N(3))-methyltransferase BMT5-like domain-containing protein n=1 Tax=Fonsecaea erecta TaxID=1367422 RepID=A0A178ZNE6_9EURO|nr:hypothetical protein AYL99_03373 [Fonsecaea erecta]OAP61172.1 hypothetical protein AYL99_03373 [Fonsecaea erecta]